MLGLYIVKYGAITKIIIFSKTLLIKALFLDFNGIAYSRLRYGLGESVCHMCPLILNIETEFED